MKKIIFYVTMFIVVSSYGQTKVGDIQFNDIDVFGGAELMLNGAGARDKMYAIALYLDFEVDGVEDGVMVAEKDATMAVTIKVMTSGAAKDFKELIRNGIERATDGNAYLIEDQIRDFLKILPEQINKYDIFKVVYHKGGDVSLYKRKELLGKIKGIEFKKALFKIWLGENPIDKILKKDLLASFQPNPVLGKWKTYDPKTGVALSIVQVYIINNRVYGSVERMLRLSERDAVCYECEGDDKNQKVEGLVIIKDMQLKKGKYVNGKFTDINTGKVSDCQLWVDLEELDVLNIKYKGSGGTHQWTKVK